MNVGDQLRLDARRGAIQIDIAGQIAAQWHVVLQVAECIDLERDGVIGGVAQEHDVIREVRGDRDRQCKRSSSRSTSKVGNSRPESVTDPRVATRKREAIPNMRPPSVCRLISGNLLL